MVNRDKSDILELGEASTTLGIPVKKQYKDHRSLVQFV
jgi:hypothetical protein